MARIWHGRGVGPEQDAALASGPAQGRLVHVERVLHVAGGVVLRDVERLEVVPVELDLRPARHLVTEPREDGDDLVGGSRHRVPVAKRQEAAPRQRHVERRAAQLLLELLRLEALASAPEQRLDLVANAVRHLADPRAFLGRELPHPAEDGRDLALLAEKADAEILQGALVARRPDGLPGPFDQALELSDEVGHRLGPRPGLPGPRPRSRPAGRAPGRRAPCGRAGRRPCGARRIAASSSSRSGARRR